MKCTECPDYHECHKENDLRRKRGRCKKAKEPLVQTNADHIRAMSDGELAAFMFSMVDCVSCQNKLMNNGKLVFGADRKTCTDKDYYAMCDGDGRKCESVCLEWLKQPAEVKKDE